jgi:hypothetical protein
MLLKKAASGIKAAFICGIFCTTVTLITTLVAIFSGGTDYGGFHWSIYSLLDVAIFTGLTVGLYFKSRVCAVLMVIYFALNKYIQFSRGLDPWIFISGVTLTYFFIQGMRDSFWYHALKNSETSQPPKLDPPGIASPPPVMAEPREP